MSAGHAARKARSAAFGAALLAAASVPAPAQVRLESATLGASDGVAGDRFGAALAADGERVVVGAPRAAGAGSGGGTGAAYVYRWNGSVWVEEAELVPSDGLANDEFGGAVAVSGERVLVGALRHSANGSSAGAAYLYELQGATWVETKLLASNGTTFDRFGTSVALDGDLAVVGAPFHVGQGKAYVFERDASGGWDEVARLEALDGSPGHQFGAAVAIDGELVAVGAPVADGAAPASGSAYLFGPLGGVWQDLDTVDAADGASGDGFGTSVDVVGGRLIVGALAADPAGTSSGAAYLFSGGGTTWTQEAKLVASDAAAGDLFGSAVALDAAASAALVGAFGRAEGGTASGAGYAFELAGGTWGEVAKLLASAPSGFASVGFAVAFAGDRHVAGAPGADGLLADTGAAYVFDGAGSPFTSFCFCPQGATCANPDPDAGCANSTGSGATLDAAGSASVLADDLVLSAGGMPAGVTTVLFMGSAQVDVPFASGRRCVAGGASGMHRFPARAADAAGQALRGPGLVTYTQGRFPAGGHVVAGSTWHFQLAYVDPQGPCGPGLDYSNALTVRFQN